jgi:rhamnopyranosyl-N-acetylglucosaminyl-diphospho-decaprenol beta-1,3/1,4-galactofuranosyltransferase
METLGHVCAVTVAYNNPEELTRLLESLTIQGSSLKGLIIIDNSDQIYAAENEHVFRVHSRQYEFAYYHKTDKNVGSAGGFRRGMMVAHENGFDWVWLLDQDGAVSPSCLAELLRHYDDGDLLCPNIVDICLHNISKPKVFAKNFLGGLYVANRAVNCHVDAFGTHAVLISKKTLDTIGYYDDSLFFVGYEDADYGYRAVQAGLVIFFVAGAEALHLIKFSTKKKLKILPAQLNLKILPAHMGYLTDLHTDELRCSKTRSMWPFSKAYLESKYLKPWQFGIALAYSECYALYRKVAGERGIALTMTLRLYLKCFADCLKKDWPYDAIEQLCREVLK